MSFFCKISVVNFFTPQNACSLQLKERKEGRQEYCLPKISLYSSYHKNLLVLFSKVF